MEITGVELRRVAMSLREPIRTSFGALADRDVVLVRVVGTESEGWGECVAPPEPGYSSEYADGAARVLERFLGPMLLTHGTVTAETAGPIMEPVRGHRMAKAALEAAVLDAQLRAAGTSFASYLGATRTRVPAGVSIGVKDSVDELLDTVAAHLTTGYAHVKLKITPGWDVVPVQAVRERFGDDLSLQVDANAAYTLADADHLARLDAFALRLIEQPLGEDQLRGHAALAGRVRTPIALDETVTSARLAADAITLGACHIINIKPGRVGGYLEARRIHDLCRAHGVAVWCGGMAETGIGRAANIALAALPAFIPGDNSASARYYEQDLTAPIELDDGHLRVPDDPGFGVTPDPDTLHAFSTATTWLPRDGT